MMGVVTVARVEADVAVGRRIHLEADPWWSHACLALITVGFTLSVGSRRAEGWTSCSCELKDPPKQRASADGRVMMGRYHASNGKHLGCSSSLQTQHTCSCP